MQIYQEELVIKGKPVKLTAVRVGDNTVIVEGNLVKTAKIKEDWLEDVTNPEEIIAALKSPQIKADIFTFWQRPPESQARYNYPIEWDNVAAIPVKSFDYWFKEQIKKQTRTNIRKAESKGVVVRPADFDDDFIKGMTDIFNETPIRQGKPFWHYGKSFETVKKQFQRNADKCDFIGAYYENELIGFIWLLCSDRFARTIQIISKIGHRDKSPTNAMLAKAVEICANKKIPYLIYGSFDYGKAGSDTLTNFKQASGFEKMLLPRYYVPLTAKGKIILQLGLHRKITEILPEKLVNYLLSLRTKWYARKYAQA